MATTNGVYDARNGHLIFNHASVDESLKMYGAAFSTDNRWLAGATPQGSIVLLDTRIWELREKVKIADGTFISISFSPDNKTVVTGDYEGTVRLWTIEPHVKSDCSIVTVHASSLWPSHLMGKQWYQQAMTMRFVSGTSVDAGRLDKLARIRGLYSQLLLRRMVSELFLVSTIFQFVSTRAAALLYTCSLIYRASLTIVIWSLPLDVSEVY